MEVNGDQQQFVSSKFYNISYFMFNIRKVANTGLEQHEGE